MELNNEYSVEQLHNLLDRFNIFVKENPNHKLKPIEIIAQLEQCDQEKAEKLRNTLLLLGPKPRSPIPEKYAKEITDMLGLSVTSPDYMIENTRIVSNPRNIVDSTQTEKSTELNVESVTNKINHLRKEDNTNTTNNSNKLK